MSWKITPKTQPARPAAQRERSVVLKVENLVKIYGERKVVDGVSFEVREGEVVGLLGANGAGKTTSFRMSCGLIPANSGRVILNGLDVTDWPMYRRAKEGRLGYLPQDRSTFGTLTTEKNLYAAMEVLGYSRSQMKKTCAELLKRFKLEHIRKTVVGMGGSGGLSGGERRRLEIARALLAHPKILLLDEPFANVDPITVEEMQSVIRELSQDGVAILITDHQVDETLAITHRSYIINQGKVLCSGTPLEVLSNPKAVKMYFGDKAEFSKERILNKLGVNPSSVPGFAENAPRLFDDVRTTTARAEETRGDDRYDADRQAFRTPSTRESSSDSSAAPQQRQLYPKRPTLTLTRRKTEVSPTPSPRDEQPEPNRFNGKLGRLFKRDD